MIYVIVCLLILKAAIILLGLWWVKRLKEKNQSLRKETCTMSNTFREKGIEIDGLKKQIKDSEDTCNVLEKENKRLRLLC